MAETDGTVALTILSTLAHNIEIIMVIEPYKS